MKTEKKILYHGDWYHEGDAITYKEEPVWFLIWRTPFYRSKKMKVGFISERSSAALIPAGANTFNELTDRTIIGRVEINKFI